MVDLAKIAKGRSTRSVPETTSRASKIYAARINPEVCRKIAEGHQKGYSKAQLIVVRHQERHTRIRETRAISTFSTCRTNRNARSPRQSSIGRTTRRRAASRSSTGSSSNSDDGPGPPPVIRGNHPQGPHRKPPSSGQFHYRHNSLPCSREGLS